MNSITYLPAISQEYEATCICYINKTSCVVNMSDITIEKKLELMRQIRSQNERNQFDMSRREQIVYEECDEEEEEFQTFPLRVLLSVALLLLIIICDMSGKSFMGIQAGQCFEAIATDYESSITAWVNAASHDNRP